MGLHVERVLVKLPDGGWGWMVLLSCFIITEFSYAFPKAVSVYFKELMKDFQVGYSDTAWISSIMLAMLYGTGPVSSILVNKFGCRPVMLIGGLLASAGMVLEEAEEAALGFQHGWGWMVLLSCFVITGFSYAFPKAVSVYFKELMKDFQVGYSDTAWISSIMLAMLYGTGLARPVWLEGGLPHYGGAAAELLHLRGHNETSGVQETGSGFGHIQGSPGAEGDAAHERGENGRGREGWKEQGQEAEEEEALGFQRLPRPSVCDIHCNKIHHRLHNPTILLVNYAKDMRVPDREAAYLLSIIGFIDIFAQPTCGVIAGLKWVRPKVAYFFSFALLFNRLTDVCSAKASSYMGLVVFCVLFGISYGMVGALQFEVLMGIVRSQKFSSALGLVILIEAFAVLIGPPSAGRLVEHSGRALSRPANSDAQMMDEGEVLQEEEIRLNLDHKVERESV
ncbi:UNVERIFIED_CONTAM: hypothetical protein FKN15_071804 [Acipenser sinensis]